MYREFNFRVTVNRRLFRRVRIDDHYAEKHAGHMNEFVILSLVRQLDGGHFVPNQVYENGLRYFVKQPVFHGNRPHRIVWYYFEHEDYLGVRNAFRIRSNQS